MGLRDIFVTDLVNLAKYNVAQNGQSSKICEDWDSAKCFRAIQKVFKEHAYNIRWKALSEKPSNREAYLKYRGYVFAKVKVALSYEVDGHSKLTAFQWSDDLLALLESKKLNIERMSLRTLFDVAIVPLSKVAQEEGRVETTKKIKKYEKKLNDVGCNSIYTLKSDIRALELEKFKIERELREKRALLSQIRKENMETKLENIV